MNKVENTEYLKDSQTGVIVNTNQRDYNNARARFTKQRSKDQKIISLQSEVVELKNNMAKILTLLENNK